MDDREKTGRERRSVWSYFKIEQGFKQRQIFRLLGLSLLNVAVSTAAFVAFMQYELSALQGGVPMSDGPSPSLIRIGIVWAAFMAGLGGLFALFEEDHRAQGHRFTAELALGFVEPEAADRQQCRPDEAGFRERIAAAFVHGGFQRRAVAVHGAVHPMITASARASA